RRIRTFISVTKQRTGHAQRSSAHSYLFAERATRSARRMDGFAGDLAGQRARLCFREIQEKLVRFQTMRAGGTGFDDAKSSERKVNMAEAAAIIAAQIAEAIKAS